ncbi:MAG TPA: ATP-binding protein, partial [Dongiaceae bacterium]
MSLPVDLAAVVQCRVPTATRQDLVLSKPLMRVLERIAVSWRERTLGRERVWGREHRLENHGARDGGISGLFSGPRGTGKTLAAEVLAHETRLDLYRVDLSHLVGHDIGETEKNLCRLFEAAESAGALLYFDEADALFGKRGEAKDVPDRCANAEVDLLLQRIEAFAGIVILATSRREDIDPAFLRRLTFAMDFALPDMAERVEIWRRIFPPDTPVEGLDPERLARLQLCGADIRDIARSSAALAASEGQPVRMAHLLRAAVRQCAKLDQPIDLAAIAR